LKVVDLFATIEIKILQHESCAEWRGEATPRSKWLKVYDEVGKIQFKKLQT
jgi:hypothetical protein